MIPHPSQAACLQEIQAGSPLSVGYRIDEPIDLVRDRCRDPYLKSKWFRSNRNIRVAEPEKDRLLILIGGVFPHAFMMPPRKTGTYVTLHLAKTAEC